MESVNPTTGKIDNHWLGYLRRLSSLRQFTPLNSLSDAHFMALVEQCDLKAAVAGQSFSLCNATTKTFLLHGRIELSRQGIRIEQLEGGESLFALAEDELAPLDVLALTDIEYVQIEKNVLNQLLTWSQVADYLHQQIALERDYDEDVDWMMSLLHSNLFLKVPPTQILAIFSLFRSRLVMAGETIIKQGEIGDSCYFIKEGVAKVNREQAGESFLVAEIREGRCFGEDALVNKAPRNASVTMTSDGVLMYLSAMDFAKLLEEPKVTHMGLSEALDKATLIDVRSEAEYGRWHLPKAVNIPLNLLAMKKRLLNHETHYVCYCESGHRSKAAAHLLSLQGFTVFALADCESLLDKSHQMYRQDMPHYLLQQGVAVPENS